VLNGGFCLLCFEAEIQPEITERIQTEMEEVRATANKFKNISPRYGIFPLVSTFHFEGGTEDSLHGYPSNYF